MAKKRIQEAGKPTPDELYRMGQAIMTDDHFNWILDREAEAIRTTWAGMQDKNAPTPDPEDLTISPQINVWGKWRGEDDYTVIPMLFLDMNDDRNEMVYAVGKRFAADPQTAKFGPAAIFLVSEAWLKMLPHGQELKGRVSQQPDRQEVVIINGLTIDGRCNMITYPVQRPHEEVKLLGDAPLMENRYSPLSNERGESELLSNFWRGYAWGKAQAAGRKDFIV